MDAVNLNTLGPIQENLRVFNEIMKNVNTALESFDDQIKRKIIQKIEELIHLIDSKVVYVKDFELQKT